MNPASVRTVSAGANQQGVRDHNARLILSTLQRLGPLPGSDLARLAGLSPQTVSVILRTLESDGLVTRGEPQRRGVGKPGVPMALAPDGAFAIGLKIGRRSADLLLADIAGGVRGQLLTTYRWPEPEPVMAFLRDGLATLLARLTPRERARVAGIGVAAPYGIWDWTEAMGAPPGALDAWRDFDLPAAVAAFSDLPVHWGNDATAACRAEHVYGRGREFRDYFYVFVGAFIGGGVVLNDSVFEGSRGNAGALGPMPAPGPGGRDAQLLDVASLHLLEERLAREGFPTERMWSSPHDWSGFPPALDDWIADTARHLARATVAMCSVIDFEALLIDGAFPPDVRRRLVLAVRDGLSAFDLRGLAPIRIEEGRVGANARALGAASIPLLARHFLSAHALPAGT